MKRTLLSLFMFLSLQLFASMEPQINWYTNYDSAVKEAQSTSKPLVLFFTGSDWCIWCNKLESEALDTREFINRVGDKFIFVKLDYPRTGYKDAESNTINGQLLKKYSIQGYPTLVVINSKEQNLGTTGYLPGGGTVIADKLLSMVKNGQQTQ